MKNYCKLIFMFLSILLNIDLKYPLKCDIIIS